jgi:hypothetical protein
MPKRSHNIHDIFVRESFSDVGRAIAFFERFLPENLVRHFDFNFFNGFSGCSRWKVPTGTFWK